MAWVRKFRGCTRRLQDWLNTCTKHSEVPEWHLLDFLRYKSKEMICRTKQGGPLCQPHHCPHGASPQGERTTERAGRKNRLGARSPGLPAKQGRYRVCLPEKERDSEGHVVSPILA